ncbi:hypothetical protein [Halobacillus salinus]|uniref:Uncharacterized protein n=1 Tax=Halobacillus salinus TaxID=192814 RepID=A0A4Z0H2W9_9BACI|nr:hypothetical protein [Halobacillus salinus]TGB04712.1 hypothetical protein E4663_06900 [Halobacillus salinus]
MSKFKNKEEVLIDLKDRFQEIIEAEVGSSIKDTRLAVLMTDVEKVFEIPFMAGRRLDAFKEKHPEVFEFYQHISLTRS